MSRFGVIYAILLTIVVIAITVLIMADHINGQEPDYRYACFYNEYPFNVICNKQMIGDAIQEVCKDHEAECADSVCERDESLCVLGRPDPDFNDTAFIIHAPIGWACFANQTLADKFLAQSGHEGFNVTIPCPQNITINPQEELK